ncbi:MAG: futalosine hydrolase [Phycisphaerae bacterium]|nr:futalosine hydrolase [Phycisphaerae bacterium]
MLQSFDRIVIVTAATAETRAVARGLGVEEIPQRRSLTFVRERFGVLETGVGKVNAASAVALASRELSGAAVLNVGVCGTLSPEAFGIGAAVLGMLSIQADEGVATPDRFVTCAELGFPHGGAGVAEGEAPTATVAADLRPIVDGEGVIATVSAGAGIDGLVTDRRDRVGAVVEAMEGAAIGQVCREIGAAFAEVRVVSNTTGDRAGQAWDLPTALARIERLVASIASVEVDRTGG